MDKRLIVPLSFFEGKPGAPDSENAGNYARSGEIYGVAWSPQHGAKCPRCKVSSRSHYHMRRWHRQNRTRYHRCPACDYRFKSIETDISDRGPLTREQLDLLRKGSR